MHFINTALAATIVLGATFAFAAPVSAEERSDMEFSHKDDGHHYGERVQNHKLDQGHSVQLGPRPFYLVADMDDSPLKKSLQKCSKRSFKRTDFSIGHRGAAMQFPEHTRESYEAAARMGAGILECDVTFTQDRELVCRHSQCDLHTTTNILAIPELATKCSVPFQPAVIDPLTGATITPAQAQCCTSDITVAEFKTLKGKMDAFNPDATTVEAYMNATPGWRTDLYTAKGTLLTHRESIELFKRLGTKMTPELKSPSVTMPFDGDYTQEAYAQQMIDEYKAAGISADKVFAQSFNLGDVLYWINHEPEFGQQTVFLDDIDSISEGYPSLTTLQVLASQGVNIIAPPMWALLDVDAHNRIVPSAYAVNARAAGLDIIGWTLGRSGLRKTGGGWYDQSVTPAVNNDGDMLEALDVLAQDVGIRGIFSDWPATVTYYANCQGLK